MIRLLMAMLLLLSTPILSAQSAIQGKPLEFKLMDNLGTKTEVDFKGKYMILAFGYTSCPDICPMTLAQINEALDKIPNDVAQNIVPVFVNIDPVNSTPETLNAYVDYFDERFVGLTGSIESVQSLTNQLGATFGYRLDGKKLEEPKLGMMYTVYHSTLIYLIGPDSKLIDTYDYQIAPEDLANKVTVAIAPNITNEREPEKKKITSISKQVAHKRSEKACALPEGFKEAKTGFELSQIDAIKSSGKKVELLNMWALWCAPCRKELPVLHEFKKHSSEMGVITLNLADGEGKITKFFDEQKFVHLDKFTYPKMDLLRKLGGIGLPFNALFVDGKQVAFKNGIIKETESLSEYANCVAK
ncbi:putative cytochrome maturation protein [Taylorella asinigenitalis 14/45]|uniref:Putative cytochrome maturation protein n=1 Tax=Taylorella asinigenitalis 14/45 TaxID=1091495 RepID=I7IK99_9BURK|nr:SCO family protein [Taylorella asinigenitalis]CCG19002.1 putative cytochrome maturation protein [Taylorella asinigenitalis 14/45]